MVLVTSYNCLQKPGRQGAANKAFAPLRAVGLSLELAWKVSRDKGFGAVVAADVSTVHVVGELRVFEEQRWRACRACDLQLRPQDASLSVAILRKERALFADLGLNVWLVDTRPGGGSVTYDLLGDFGTAKNFGVTGRVWVELKVHADGAFESEVARCKQELAAALPQERDRDPSLQGVLLVVAKVPRAGAGHWGTPTLHAMLLSGAATDWINVAGGSRRAGRGQCIAGKPALTILWGKMQWVRTAQGMEVALLRHFLEALGLPVNNAGQRAATFNTLLRQNGSSGKLFEAKIANKTGRKPWVGTKATFRDLYQFV